MTKHPKRISETARGASLLRATGIITAAAMAAALAAGCPLVKKTVGADKGDKAAGSSAGAPAPAIEAAPVRAALAVEKEIPIVLKAIGAVEAASTVAIKAQVGGELLAIRFKEGETVKKGDLLFTLDDRVHNAALKGAEAMLAKNRAEFENAQQEAARFETLAQNKAISRNELDNARTRVQTLNAAARAEEAAIDVAKLNIEFCQIHAPLAGRAGSLNVHIGNLIKANADGAMVVINQIDPIQVSFAIPEQRLPEVRRRMAEGKLAVEASVAGEPKPAVGELAFVDNAVNAETGTVRLKANFDNSSGMLWPGQFVNARLLLSSIPKAVVVPLQAVQTGQKGPFVYVVKADQTAEFRPITPGPTVGTETAILKGLEAGELVVTDGHLRVLPGKPVSVKDPDAKAADAKAAEAKPPEAKPPDAKPAEAKPAEPKPAEAKSTERPS